MNEELLLAISQYRQRSPDQTWLIPVRFDDCDIPGLEEVVDGVDGVLAGTDRVLAGDEKGGDLG